MWSQWRYSAEKRHHLVLYRQVSSLLPCSPPECSDLWDLVFFHIPAAVTVRPFRGKAQFPLTMQYYSSDSNPSLLQQRCISLSLRQKYTKASYQLHDNKNRPIISKYEESVLWHHKKPISEPKSKLSFVNNFQTSLNTNPSMVRNLPKKINPTKLYVHNYSQETEIVKNTKTSLLWTEKHLKS